MIKFTSSDNGVRIVQTADKLQATSQVELPEETLSDLTAKVRLVDRHVRASTYYGSVFDNLAKMLLLSAIYLVMILVTIWGAGLHTESASLVQQPTRKSKQNFLQSFDFEAGEAPAATFYICDENNRKSDVVINCRASEGATISLDSTKNIIKEKLGLKTPDTDGSNSATFSPNSTAYMTAMYKASKNLNILSNLATKEFFVNDKNYFLVTQSFWNKLFIPVRVLIILFGLNMAGLFIICFLKEKFTQDFMDDKKNRILEVSRKLFADYGGYINLEINFNAPVTYIVYLEEMGSESKISGETKEFYMPKTAETLGLLTPVARSEERSMVRLNPLDQNSVRSVK